VLVPLAHTTLFSGLALSLGTPWGLFRHYWVVLKLAITVFATVILMIYMGTFRQMAGVAADPVVELGLVRNPSPLLHSVLALILLVAATVLGIYKPFGMTPFGQRSTVGQGRAVPSVSAATAGGGRWPYFFGALLLAIVAIFVIMHLTGSMPFQHNHLP
jgi:hypothetical protein